MMNVGHLVTAGAARGQAAIRVCVVSLALSIAFGSAGASLERRSAQDPNASGTTNSSKRMADGKQWTTRI